ADESNRVRQQDLPLGRQRDRAQGWIERCKHARRSEYSSLGESVKQCRLSSIGVSHERDCFHGHGRSTLTLLSANPPHVLELLLDVTHAPVNLTAIGFELRFARSSGTNAAAEL